MIETLIQFICKSQAEQPEEKKERRRKPNYKSQPVSDYPFQVIKPDVPYYA